MKTYALRRLKFQLHQWSMNDLFDGIQDMCACPNKEARQLVITEAARSCIHFPVLAQTLQKAAREVEGFAIDLEEALLKVHRRLED